MRAIAEQEPLLIFRVGGVTCCAPVRDVDSIVIPQPMNNIPGQASDIAGVFQYRSHTVSVVKLHTKFGLPDLVDQSKGRIIMAYTHHGLTGFWADDIEEITSGYEVDFSTPPKFVGGNVFDKTLIWKDRMVLHTDFDRLYAMKDAAPLKIWMQEHHLSELGADQREDDNNKVVSLRSDAELGHEEIAEQDSDDSAISEADLNAIADSGQPDTNEDVAEQAVEINDLEAEDQQVKDDDLATHQETETELTADEGSLKSESTLGDYDTQGELNTAVLDESPELNSEQDIEVDAEEIETQVDETEFPVAEISESQSEELYHEAMNALDSVSDLMPEPEATEETITDGAFEIVQASPLDDQQAEELLVSEPAQFERTDIEPLSNEYIRNDFREHASVEAVEEDETRANKSGNLLSSYVIDSKLGKGFNKEFSPIKIGFGVSALVLVAAIGGYLIFGGSDELETSNVTSNAVGGSALVEESVEEPVSEVTPLNEPMESLQTHETSVDEPNQEAPKKIATLAEQDRPSKLIPLESLNPAPPLKPVEPQLPIWGVHVVSNGDTLWHLAKLYLNDPFKFPDLAKWSNITNPDRIFPGDNVKYRKDKK